MLSSKILCQINCCLIWMEREWLNTLSSVPYVKDLMNVSQIDICRLSSTCSNLVSSTNKIPLYFVELKSQDHSKLQYQRFLLLTCELPISVRFCQSRKQELISFAKNLELAKIYPSPTQLWWNQFSRIAGAKNQNRKHPVCICIFTTGMAPRESTLSCFLSLAFNLIYQ